jgi:hypothetical protein
MALPRTTEIPAPSENKELAAQVLEQTEREIADMSALMNPLLELRHKLFDVGGTDFSKEASIASQLYDLPDYNDEFIAHDFGVREGNVRAYHDTTEVYDDVPESPSDTERNRIYRRAIMAVAQELGFISKKPGESANPIDRHIGILDSELKPIPEKVAAIVINGAAGMSNIMRVRDAVRNIESGAIHTDRIVVSAGERVVNDAEKGRVIKPYRAGNSEFESMKFALEDLTGATFDTDPEKMPVPYGENLTAKRQSTQVNIADRIVTIDIIEAPFDTRRVMDDGSPAKRINTDEAFLSTVAVLEGAQGAIVMQSHDTWTPWQAVMARELFTLKGGRNVYAAGPLKADRVFWAEENGQQVMDIKAAQDVVDELKKTYKQLVKLEVAAKNALEAA